MLHSAQITENQLDAKAPPCNQPRIPCQTALYQKSLIRDGYLVIFKTGSGTPPTKEIQNGKGFLIGSRRAVRYNSY